MLVGELDRHQQHDQRGQQEEALEEQRQAVERIHLAEGILHWLPGRKLHAEQAVKQDQAHANGGSVAELPFGRKREPQINEQQPQPEGQHQQFVTEQ